MRLSLILPYWDRQEAANKAFKLLEEQYADLDMEIIVMDDGNAIPFVAPDVNLDIRTIRLPLKHEPKSPVTVWNEGVKAARGDIIVLSCVEILHKEPVLLQMKEELKRMGMDGYVLAAAWCPEEAKWHCHSTVKLPRNPEGTGLSFCSMMYKELYDRAGGFDEEYRDGAGYEDNDFINRLLAVGARFNILDDLVVIHPKSGASISWKPEAFARNEAMFYAKWPNNPITFVCVNWGNYCDRGAEYVNILFDGVRRNLPNNCSAKFVCYTDNSDGLSYYVEPRPLPEGIKGWWSKLYLFKAGLFEEGERVIYLDLDSCIVGPLDNIIKYEGDFATLRDFYQPDRVGPGIMLWRGGFGANIWDSYEEAGYPTDNDLGDLYWINKCFEDSGYKCDILQDLFPKQFCSYKVHAKHTVPYDASVVCFHGFPRPHEAGGWVDHIWKIGGGTEFLGEIKNNSSFDVISKNIAHSSALLIPWLQACEEHSGEALLIGGGPSLTESLAEIAIRQQNGHKIFATNGTYQYLRDAGIIPDFAVIIDARPENVKFADGADERTIFYLASQCDSALFAAAPNVVLMHMNYADRPLESMVPKTSNEQSMVRTAIIGGGSTVGIISLSLAHTLGYRKFHLYGMDSSYKEAEHHAYEQRLNEGERVLEVEAEGRQFRAAPWMIQQVNEFQFLASLMANEGCVINVRGDGLLPHVAQVMANQQQVENAA